MRFAFSLRAKRIVIRGEQKNKTKSKIIFVIVWIFFVSSAYRYTPETKKFKISKNWWAQVDSNHRPHAYQACALTTWAMSPCCYPRCISPTCPSSFSEVVEMNGIEPMTPCLQSRCSPSWATPPCLSCTSKIKQRFSRSLFDLSDLGC